MQNQITDAEWLLPFFVFIVTGLPILLAIWGAWRLSRRSPAKPLRKSRFTGTPRNLFPPEGAIVEERRRRAMQ